MYSIENSPKIDLIFKKLAKKNPKQLETIARKLPEIVENPHRFKPLGNIMKGFRRVHFGHYILTFSILGLIVVVYRTQKYIWALDMQAKNH